MDLISMGERIKTIRTEKKLTLEKLSEKIGISRNFLWEIEAGRKSPAIQTLYNISKELNVSIDYLFGLSYDIKYLNQKNEKDTISEINASINELSTEELFILSKLLNTYLKNSKKQ